MKAMGDKGISIYTDNLFSFWAVGQGLFYTAKIDIRFRELSGRLSPNLIDSFNILYDIGTSNKKDRLTQIVNRYFTNKKFDLCFISHFHEDHVNGFKELTENKVEIERIIVPYVTTIESILLSLMSLNVLNSDDNDSNGGDKGLDSDEDKMWYYREFIKNPYFWILENLKPKYLYVLTSKPDNLSPFEYNNADINPPLEEPPRIEENIKENNKIRESFFQDYPNLEKYSGKIKFCEQGSFFKITPLWLFVPFYLEAEKAKLEEFQKCLKEQGIKNITSDIIMEKRKEIRECYEKLFGDVNLTSLTLYHQPIIYNKCNYRRNVIIPFKHYIEMSNSGQFLLGDIDLTTHDKYNEFKKFYQSFLKKNFVFQVPHHGSFRNWNKAFLKDFSSMYWIITAGKSNSNGHPSEEVITDICQSGKCPVWIHEEWKEDRFLIDSLIEHWRKKEANF
jgi:hypothetical protein